ncbi:hypothetical protein ACI2LC_46470 [Nonomuraea wenchangensis]|uniref:hypothetical protein n=1 Tax=Nonomuraea TaxID=83681 RepID=UPI0037A948D7
MGFPAQDAWGDAALLQTLGNFLGVGSDSDYPDDVRFLVAVTQLLQKRIRQGELSKRPQRPAIFCLHAQPTDMADGRPTRHFPMLDNGLEPVSGHIWFVNKAANEGVSIELKADDTDSNIFTRITDELDSGEVPTIVFETRTPSPEVRYYPEGLTNIHECRKVKISGEPVTLVEIFAVIDRLYRQQLCTPDAQGKGGKLWEDADKFTPIKDAEDRIQVVLRSGLTGSFPTCYIYPEQPGPAGRLDIIIEESSPNDRSMITRHAILELKVLRSHWSSGSRVSDNETQQWISDGVEQAASYRDERGARYASLCCFDMRKTPALETCFAHVHDLAGQLHVECRVWHLFASSKAYRHHVLGEMDATTA